MVLASWSGRGGVARARAARTGGLGVKIGTAEAYFCACRVCSPCWRRRASIQASHAVYYGFSTLDWRAAGLDGTTIGALWALGVVAEIALFALSGRLPAWISPTVLLAIGGAGATLRWGAMAFDPPVWLLPALQGLHGLSFGATHLGSVSFLAARAPPGAAATAQGALAVVLGLVMAAAMAASGVLYATFGTRAYRAMALLAAAGGVIALIAYRTHSSPEH